MSFVIEHGVPVPLRGGKKKYPFGDMAVGDSFEFPEGDRMRVFASAKARDNEKYVTRKVGDGSCRIWRVK